MGMTEKTEITDEQVALALGWKFDASPGQFPGWFNADPEDFSQYAHVPDFTNDLNAAWKYVWPELILGIDNKAMFPARKMEELRHILFQAFMKPNPALYLCEAFLKLKGDE